MSWKKYSPIKSPFLIVGVFSIPVCLIGAFYYLLVESGGGGALAGIFFLFGLLGYSIVLIFEQGLLISMKIEGVMTSKLNRIVWITEIIILGFLILFLKDGLG